jgi:hypothetical protein
MEVILGSKKIPLPVYGEHALFLGATNSGKSYLAEHMLMSYENFIAFDTQDSLEIIEKLSKKVRTPQQLTFLLSMQKLVNRYSRLRYVPDLEYRNRLTWNYVIRKIAASSTKKKPHPKILMIDEIFHLGWGMSFPNELPQAISTCRQKKISLFVNTQMPKNLPGALITQAKYIFVFFLNKEEEIKYTSGFVRQDRKEFINVLYDQKLDNSFILINGFEGTWEKYPALSVKGVSV